MSESSGVGIAVFGAGKWGQNLVRNFAELGALVGIADVSPDVVNKFRAIYPDVQISTELSDLLENPLVTAVVIASPAYTHFRLARQALLAGKDVYVEKPLCLTLSEAESLVELAVEHDRVLMGGHLLRYHPHFIKLKKMVREGALGELLSIQARRQDLGRFRFEENALWNFAPHDFSLILALIGKQWPSRIRCSAQRCLTSEVEDNAFVDLSFESGLHAHVSVSWIHPVKEQQLVVVGRSAMAVFDDTKPWDQKLVIFENYLDYDDNAPLLEKVEGRAIEVEKKEPLRQECQHFINCCLNRSQPETDGAESLQVIALLEAAQTSMEDGGQTVEVGQKPRQLVMSV